jgi:predicted DNA-binding transcriptional regulator AlpA
MERDPVRESTPQAKPTRYLTAIQVRARYGGRTDVWLWRRLQDKGDPFPPPTMTMASQRLWLEADLDAYDEEKRKAGYRPRPATGSAAEKAARRASANAA